MSFLDDVQARASASVRRIVFPETADDRVIAAARELARRRIVEPILVLDPERPDTHAAVRAAGLEVRTALGDPVGDRAAERLFDETRRASSSQRLPHPAFSTRRSISPTRWLPPARPTDASPARPSRRPT